MFLDWFRLRSVSSLKVLGARSLFRCKDWASDTFSPGAGASYCWRELAPGSHRLPREFSSNQNCAGRGGPEERAVCFLLNLLVDFSMEEIYAKFVSQKISKTRWRPVPSGSLQTAETFATGSWDNEVPGPGRPRLLCSTPPALARECSLWLANLLLGCPLTWEPRCCTWASDLVLNPHQVCSHTVRTRAHLWSFQLLTISFVLRCFWRSRVARKAIWILLA